MDLAAHQQGLLGLIRSTWAPGPGDDTYLLRVACSAELVEARRNIFLWRIFVLERTCALSFALLKRNNLLQASVAAFIAQSNISPFRETQGPAFLDMLGHHGNSLVSSVARFELALMRARLGDLSTRVVDWDFDPLRVLHDLATGAASIEPVAGRYRTVVSPGLPGLFRIESSREA